MSKNKDRRDPGEFKTLDMFLREEGLLEETTQIAQQRVEAIKKDSPVDDGGCRTLLREVTDAQQVSPYRGWDLDTLNVTY